MQPLPQDGGEEEGEESGEEGSDAEEGEEAKADEENAEGAENADEKEEKENDDEDEDSSEEDEDMKPLDNRKVRFAETFAQREEVKKAEEEPVEKPVVPEKEVDVNAKPKKVKVN